MEREDLITHCKAMIEILEISVKNGCSDTPEYTKRSLEVHRIALDSLNGEAPYHCEHDGATYYDMSGRERCARCGADI